jgi:predicted DNA-binding ribbon-helix-helix protein
MPARYLPIYLNDHLTGATLGVELAKRARSENQGTELGSFLDELCSEIVEDRRALISLMRGLGIAPSRAKIAAGWIAEKLGRLKLNGEVKEYSPLSRVLELEGLRSGIDAKREMWLALQEISDRDVRLQSAPLDDLIARARSQSERLDPHRRAAARTAFG